MVRTHLATPRMSANTLRSHPSELSKTALPQKASKKNSTVFSMGTKLLSEDTPQKSESSDLPDYGAVRLNSTYRFRLEACRITGFLTCSNGCLIFLSRDSDLKIPAHLGGPGDQELLSPSAQNYSLDYGFLLNRDQLNSGTFFDLSYWAMENDTNFSYQSLLSSQSRCFSGRRKLWSSVYSPLNLRKRGIKQFWTTLLSKKSKNNRQSVDLDAPSVQTLVGCDQHSTSQMETLRLEWPLTTLRQFAFHGCLFKMETGRRAPHGEGHYLFRIPNITMFRQNLEAHIKHQKRSRSLKTRSAVCCPSTVLSPPPSVPPPPPPLVISNQTYVNIPLFPPKLNRSWTNLLQPNAEIAGRAGATEGCNDNGEDDSDWMVELSSPPPPPPASAPPLSQEIDAQSPLIDQPPLHRIGTYENVRSLLQSQETKSATSRSATVAPHFFGKDVVSTATSTLNYAMLDFQLPSNTASAIATYTGNLTVRSPPLQPHSTPLFSSSSCERLVQVPSTRLSRRLARSMEAQLNAVRGSGEAERPMSMTGSGVGGNYVDICPLQTLAINELLRSTL
ncbi:hypothetical protein EGR_08311 [Echinococcus granulosus]|uniref:IRS-type PTB domain-containing protein n=1 Tax=Echinococcus granulosus TaxID=6210 RepID=W6UFB4_ECHGR|nr:hypothetical protein EGR_08311 [Echinococcus granulosus]EUB56842.1 hypothetical protein EGR_08311 [Echinococcus granulosus]